MKSSNYRSDALGTGGHLELDGGNSPCRVQSLGTRPRTVEDRVASVHRKTVLHLGLSLSTVCVSTVCHPSVSLHQHGRSKVLILVPPVRRTRGRTACTKNALVHPIELLSVLNALVVFSLLGRVVVLQERLDRLVLLVELRHVRDEILDDVHVRQRVKLGSLGFASIDTRETGQGVNSVDVHGARSANSFSAGSSESKGRVEVVLDLDESIQDHGSTLREIELVRLKSRLLVGEIGVPSVDLELLHQLLLLGSLSIGLAFLYDRGEPGYGGRAESPCRSEGRSRSRSGENVPSRCTKHFELECIVRSLRESLYVYRG